MVYDFDTPIERRGTLSIKWDSYGKDTGAEDILPLWVADLDFTSPPSILDALRKRIDHGVFGYSYPSAGYYNSITRWMKKRFDWAVEKEWIVSTRGVVCSINVAISAFTRPGDRIIVQPPVYYPFLSSVLRNNRRLVYNPLKLIAGRYRMDLDDLQTKIDPHTSMLILCSPHNPGGRVWGRDELVSLGNICLKHGLIMLSDEIHSDIVFREYRHIPIASLSTEFAEKTVTLNAPTKTFNIAGIGSSYALISNPSLRRLFIEKLGQFGIGTSELFGIVATEAGYTHGDEWLKQLLAYLEDNLGFLTDFIKERTPQIRVIRPEGTYLVWLDFRNLGLDEKRLDYFVRKKAGLGLSSGTHFGPGGDGFQRINIGCPRETLRKALHRLEKAINDL